MPKSNLLLFFVLAIVVMFGWDRLRVALWPPPPKKEEDPQAKKDDKKEPVKPPVEKPVKPLPPEKSTPANPALTLGGDGSRFFLRVVLERRGAGVRSITLRYFKAADSYGRPEYLEKDGQKVPKSLELVPDDANSLFASHLLYHYDTINATDTAAPLDTLGRIPWQIYKNGAEVENPRKVEDAVSTQVVDGDRVRQTIEFRTEVYLKRKGTDGKGIPVQVSKIYSLMEGDYHLGLDVKLLRVKTETDEDKKSLKFRYQLTGAHGLPIEGRWYTGTFRNILVGQVTPGGAVDRPMEDMRQMSLYGGGDEIPRRQGKFIRYAAVAIQYFASAIVVSDQQVDDGPQDFLRRVRGTLEFEVVQGVVTEVSEKGRSFKLQVRNDKEFTFHLDTFMEMPEKGKKGAVKFYVDADQNYRLVAMDPSENVLQPLFEDDATVRVTTEDIDLTVGKEVTHRYLLYNGPIKTSLLGQLTGEAYVDSALVDRYVNTLKLNTMVDYPSPGWLGAFGNAIYFTPIVIWFTNLMHWILWQLHKVIPSYGLCIIFLTILVRGMMFPVSRNQTLTSIKMQELAPELKKMHEKYKDDRQAMGLAQMALYRKHGINPFASCWFLLLQMPIYMGLYFAFQESISFRLAEFWPFWMPNLAAPDMMFWWGEGIPLISTPGAYGTFFYLGPYFNLLPIIAVSLMLVQQKIMTPPPTDEQQEMQMKMLKYMTIFFGLMFYKVAAGLCIYFIASSIWGFAERRLLPKRKPIGIETSADQMLEEKLGSTTSSYSAPAAALSSGSTSYKSGKKGRNRRRQEDREANGDPAKRGWWQKVRDWWEEVKRKAEKK